MEALKENLKYYRKKTKKTQKELANSIGVGVKSLSNWETGFNLPPLDILVKMSKIFGVPIDVLIGNNSIIKPQSKNLFVPIAAQAGYLKEWSEDGIYTELEPIYIPGVPKDRESRTFEVEGSSMTPLIFSGDLVVCIKVERDTEFHGDNVYVVVTKRQGILIKHIEVNQETEQLRLISSNQAEYKDNYVDLDDVLEIWHAKMKVTRHLTSIALNQNNDDIARRMQRLEQLFLDQIPRPEQK